MSEVLAIAIKEQQNIKGIVVGTKEIKLTQYADDTCAYLNGSNSLENIVKLFEDFYRYAGLKLNIDKTEAIWLGRNNRYGKICGIKIMQEPIKVLGIWLSKNSKEISSLNLDQRIEKLRTLLNLWSQRGLTIKGKITIIKSKALPLITFATNFIYVPKDVIETIETILYDFVWKKKHHVKKTTLVETPAKGGLKMPNAAAIIKSNKLNLIKRLLNIDSNCNTTAAFFLRTNNIEKFLSYKNNTKYLHPLPKYYEQLLNMWYSINNREPASIDEILSESIWLNERILVGNRPVYNKAWIDAGILCIKDLLNGNCFMTQAQIEENYVSCDFLYYNGLRLSIPQGWLKHIFNTENIGTTTMEQIPSVKVKLGNKFVDIRKMTCSQIYWAEIKTISQRPTSYFKWESEYFFATFDWDQINVIPYECTSETYLQSLQFKIIHRYFPCKYNLKLWNIEDSSRCNSCNQVDTLCHYFAECSLVCDFWKYLKTWFLRAFEYCINFTALDILLGIPNFGKNNDIDILNFVILFAKSYIYDCKKKEMPIDLYNFQVKLKTHMVIQEYRCKVYNKTEEFESKWALLADSL